VLRFMDAGESHGTGITTIVEGLPYGLPLKTSDIEGELDRRRLGYGRGPRMALERDHVEIMSGLRFGITLGSPLALRVRNAEYEKWREVMNSEGERKGDVMTRLRPGHADLAGVLKYGTRDVRDVLERASARSTVGRVCAGAAAKALLRYLDIAVLSHVLTIGSISVQKREKTPEPDELKQVDKNSMRCLEPESSALMMEEIDKASQQGDSLGGIFEVIAYGLPAGLGSHVQWDRRLDGRLSAAVMSIPAVKGVEIGDGFALAVMYGSRAGDTIHHSEEKGFYRITNHAGGLEGGMTNGECLLIRAAMKPIPTLGKPLDSVDIESKESVKASVERADTCAVPAAAVIAESAVAFVLAGALLEKVGGDNIKEIEARYQNLIVRQNDF
jgi:chorismate synthase